MKKQKKKRTIKVRDLKAKKDARGGKKAFDVKTVKGS
jgi:hypothetical protein